MHSTIADWVILDSKYTEAYCANGKSGLSTVLSECLINALDKVDQSIDFSLFDTNSDGYIDAIAFLHSGYGAEHNSNTDWIWSHKSGFGDWTSSEGVKVSTYHISPALWGSSGSEIGRIGVIAHETAHLLYVPQMTKLIIRLAL
jgi:M6 family metalloprotease-like protein